jgi:hypothetical protein
MATEKRIVGHISQGGQTYGPGDEEAFDALELEKNDIARLESEGVIEGYVRGGLERVSADPTILAGRRVPARDAGHDVDMHEATYGGDPVGRRYQSQSIPGPATAPEGAAKDYGQEKGTGNEPAARRAATKAATKRADEGAEQAAEMGATVTPAIPDASHVQGPEA